MSNPFEFFNASDDEEDSKVTVVKKEDKPKHSMMFFIQPMQRKEPTKSKKKIVKRELNKLLNLHLFKKPFLLKPNKVTNIPTWKERKSNGSKNK